MRTANWVLGFSFATLSFACGGHTPHSSASPQTESESRSSSPAPIARLDFLRDQFGGRFSAGAPSSFAFVPHQNAILYRRNSLENRNNALYEKDLQTGLERVIATSESILGGQEENLTPEERARRERMRLIARGISTFFPSPDGEHILIPLSNRLHVVARSTGHIEHLETGEGSIVDPQWSPQGHFISFVRVLENKHELVVFNVQARTNHVAAESDAPEHSLGLAEFVAQEEMDRFSGYWWSSDESTLLFQRTDTSQVGRLHLADPAHPESGGTSFAYPRPGTPNADVRLFVVPSQLPDRAMLARRPERRPAQEHEITWDRNLYPYVAHVAAIPGGANFAVLLQDREQHRLVVTRTAGHLLHTIHEEQDETWVNIPSSVPAFASDGRTFLWMSERSGQWQAEERNTEDGQLARELATKNGVLEFVQRSENTAWFLGSDDPTQQHIWTLDLQSNEWSERTHGETMNDVVVGDAGFLVRRRSIDENPVAYLVRNNGQQHTLENHAESPSLALNISFERVGELQTAAAVLRPHNFDPSRKYPVLLYVYGGPHLHLVIHDRARFLLPQFFAEQGFVVVVSDGRGTPARGRDFERAIYKNFSDVPLNDQVQTLRSLFESHPEMDASRVGIFGWSFGGYLSALSTIRRPDVFACGVAGAPVTDWGHYDTHYTERYLGLPEEASESGTYAHNSVLQWVSDATGDDRRDEGQRVQDRARLLLVHGTADDNVSFSHSLLLIDRLVAESVPFEFLPLIGSTHMVADAALREQETLRTFSFFRECLHLQP